MNNRKAFTLIELLVVIGIIAILAGILLPAVNHMRIKAQITAQQADFASISTALEQYKQDFGDYPRNAVLPHWSTYQNGTVTPAPIFLSLATALIGPGPGITQNLNGGSGAYETGDGADGFGFRAQTMNFPVTVSSVSTSSATLNGTIPPQVNTFVAGQTVALLTMSAGTTYEETVGIATITGGNTLNFGANSAFSSHAQSDAYILRIATGKVWGPYLSADNFKIAFVPSNNTLGGPTFGYGPAGEAVLLDRWGQVIQYFPRYGPVGNRTNDSISFNSGTDTSVMAGPLYGYSEPWSLEGKATKGNGQNAIWDLRDGAPFLTNTSPSSSTPNQLWGDTTGPYFNPEQAIEWMLGDNQTSASGTPTLLTNVIRSPDKLDFDQPFILISAGPDGPNRPNGGFANLVDPTTGNILSTPQQLLQAFQKYGNIYNFDRQ
jgi:prepilin-type N-terminal cleavage/methylation domain-containing protein